MFQPVSSRFKRGRESLQLQGKMKQARAFVLLITPVSETTTLFPSDLWFDPWWSDGKYRQTLKASKIKTLRNQPLKRSAGHVTLKKQTKQRKSSLVKRRYSRKAVLLSQKQKYEHLPTHLVRCSAASFHQGDKRRCRARFLKTTTNVCRLGQLQEASEACLTLQDPNGEHTLFLVPCCHGERSGGLSFHVALRPLRGVNNVCSDQ